MSLGKQTFNLSEKGMINERIIKNGFTPTVPIKNTLFQICRSTFR